MDPDLVGSNSDPKYFADPAPKQIRIRQQNNLALFIFKSGKFRRWLLSRTNDPREVFAAAITNFIITWSSLDPELDPELDPNPDPDLVQEKSFGSTTLSDYRADILLFHCLISAGSDL